jgi:hypothetical protein
MVTSTNPKQINKVLDFSQSVD